MPYVSAAQRAYLHIHEPALAAKWDRLYGGKIVPSKKKVARKRTRKRRGVARKRQSSRS